MKVQRLVGTLASLDLSILNRVKEKVPFRLGNWVNSRASEMILSQKERKFELTNLVSETTKKT